ncbi:type VI immunity family protein [Ectopseudomonas khazarica]|uniref:Type VI immunity family protein n=1 Tax=Ectopseudomonas khazarica TaxID=2502979 RepID=A0ABW7M7P3_9GAMM
MNALEKLKERAPDLEFELPDGAPAIKLGLIVTLYFKEGYTAESKKKVVECFERFYEEFKSDLKWQAGEKYQKLTPERFNKQSKFLLETTPNEQYEWHISSAKNEKESRAYSLQAMNSFEIHGDKTLSYIKLTMPWSILSEPNGSARYQKWLVYLCNQVNAAHGYGGLSSSLPYDYDSYMPAEYQLAQNYMGLEVDTLAYWMGNRLQEHIKGVNWFTVLGNAYVDRLGGEDAIRHSLSGRGDIDFFNYDYGLIIRAGQYPDLGAAEDGPPAAYVAVNKVVKPVRIPNPDSLHSYSPYGDCFDEESTARWYARFDREHEDHIPSSIPAGQPCSREGYWYSPAKQSSRRHFRQGEIMPELKDSSWGATIWYWSSV